MINLSFEVFSCFLSKLGFYGIANSLSASILNKIKFYLPKGYLNQNGKLPINGFYLRMFYIIVLLINANKYANIHKERLKPSIKFRIYFM